MSLVKNLRCHLDVWLAGCDTAEFQTTSAMPTSCLLDVQLKKNYYIKSQLMRKILKYWQFSEFYLSQLSRFYWVLLYIQFFFVRFILLTDTYIYVHNY